MDIICKRCATTDCECVPYDVECDQKFRAKEEEVKTDDEDNSL